MKNFIEWLEKDKARTRKVLAISIFLTWEVVLFISIWLLIYKIDILSILGIVTAQLVSVLAFYMFTAPKESNG